MVSLRTGSGSDRIRGALFIKELLDPVATAPGSDTTLPHPNGFSIDGLCSVKNFGPVGVM